MLMERNEIVSSTDIVKNFSKYRELTKQRSRTIIFKNNKPDLALLDINEYENLLKILELVEDMQIKEMVKERTELDDGVRYSISEIRERRKAKKQSVSQSIQA